MARRKKEQITADRIASLKTTIAARFRDDGDDYDDANVASDAMTVNHVYMNETQVREIRHGLGLLLPGETRIEAKEPEQNEGDETMKRIYLKDDDYSKLADFIAANSGHTEKDLVNLVNDANPLGLTEGKLSISHIRRAKKITGKTGQGKASASGKNAGIDKAKNILTDGSESERTFAGLIEKMREVVTYADELKATKQKAAQDLFF